MRQLLRACGFAALVLPAALGLLAALAASPTELHAQQAPDSARLMRTIGVLAHDSMEGRKVGTAGSAKARRFLIAELTKRGVKPFDGKAFTQAFRFRDRHSADTLDGTNLIGVIRGSKHPS